MKIKHTRHDLPMLEDEIERIVEDILKRIKGQKINDFLLHTTAIDIADAIHDEIIECEVFSIDVTYGISGFYVILNYKEPCKSGMHTFRTVVNFFNNLVDI